MPNIFTDNFDSYNNGNLPGQGSWVSYAVGNNFQIQGAVTKAGAKAIYNSAAADSVITKIGSDITTGSMGIYFKSVSRATWGANRYFDIRINHGAWGAIFTSIQFKSDGHWYMYNAGTATYIDIGTWNDAEWIALDVEWRASDKKARARINLGTWTDWYLVYGNATYAHFSSIGFDFYTTGGSGGIYIDEIVEAIPIPNTPTSQTNAATSEAYTTATLNGEVTNDYDITVDYYGFVWDTETHIDPEDTDPTASDYANSYKSDVGDYGIAAQSRNITGLLDNTRHYFRFCSHNVNGWSYGAELTLDTPLDVSGKWNEIPDITRVLVKDNAVAFTPTSDYEPATKKYVDDAIAQHILDYH